VLIGDFLLLAMALSVVVLGVSRVGAHRQRSLALRVPPSGESRNNVEMRQVSHYYRLAKRMAHELDALLLQDEQLPFMTDKRREGIHDLLNEWESM
jgi:FtsZ-interacting cell division protein ZipA